MSGEKSKTQQAVDSATHLWGQLGFTNDRLNQIPTLALGMANYRELGEREAKAESGLEIQYLKEQIAILQSELKELIMATLRKAIEEAKK